MPHRKTNARNPNARHVRRGLFDGSDWPTRTNEAYSLNQQVTRIDEDESFFSTRFVETQLFKRKKCLRCGWYGHLKKGVCAAQLTLLTKDTTMEGRLKKTRKSTLSCSFNVWPKTGKSTPSCAFNVWPSNTPHSPEQIRR